MQIQRKPLFPLTSTMRAPTRSQLTCNGLKRGICRNLWTHGSKNVDDSNVNGEFSDYSDEDDGENNTDSGHAMNLSRRLKEVQLFNVRKVPLPSGRRELAPHQ